MQWSREHSDNLVDDNVVAACIAEIKYKKDVGDEGIPVEILKMFPPCGISRLKDLFNLCLLCDYVPTEFTNVKLIPIVKDAKEDLNSSDNYRCICMVDSLSKLFDLIMLHFLKGIVDISSVQFGFRVGQSTDLCCNILKMIVSRFRMKGSYVFSCCIDQKKHLIQLIIENFLKFYWQKAFLGILLERCVTCILVSG